MQQAQGGDRLVELALEEIGLKAEIERKSAMQIASQPPDPVEIVEHGVAKAWHLRPQIGGPKRRPGQQFRIVGRKFEADIEGLLDVGGLARIERFAAKPDVAAVAAGAGEGGGLPDRRPVRRRTPPRSRKPRHQVRRNAMSR